MTIDIEATLGGLIPVAPIPPLPEPVPFEVIWRQVEDIGHEQDAYYKLGWRCISRHPGYALLSRERNDEKLWDVLVMVENDDP